MDIFGEHWKDHPERIAANWDKLIKEEDLVLVAGDISWAMRLDEAADDLNYLHMRPGTKLLIRGNHDYWWPGINKLRAALPERTLALQNDSFKWGEFGIAGTRGWTCPGSKLFNEEEDRRIYEREVSRLRLSLSTLPEIPHRLAMLHFPPTNEALEPSGFTKLFKEFGIEACVFGHLHGLTASNQGLTGERDGIYYYYIACDAIDFTPLELDQHPAG